MPTFVRFYKFGSPEKLQLENGPSQQPARDQVIKSSCLYKRFA